MHHRMSALTPFRHSRSAQHGIALFVVIVFVLLSMLLALWASRTSLFNEMVVGNDADYQRAFEAAQAMVQDAEQDIRLSNESPESSTLCATGGDVCRANTLDQFPQAKLPETTEALLGTLSTQTATAGCRSGLCTRREGAVDFWNDSSTLEKMVEAGARYGLYTGAKYGDADNPANPILADRSAKNKGAWYWIEVLPYDESAKTSNLIVGASASNNLLRLHIDPNVVYRITALAYGRKASTLVVLQQTYAPQRLMN